MGHLIGLSACHHLQLASYKPIFLLGDATASIGDPSGKLDKNFCSSGDGGGIFKTTQQQHQKTTTTSNAEKIKNQIQKIMLKTGNSTMEFVNNSSWHKERNLLSFMEGEAKRIQMAPLLSRSIIRDDKNGISLSAFLYQILQGLDFEHLYREKGCLFQIGGSDQWGNMITGYDIIKRSIPSSSPYAFTFPLLSIGSTGDKMGKSNGNAIFLSPTLTSPFEMFQFFLSLGDEEASMIWPLISFSFPYRKDLSVQQNLATTIVSLLHGEDGLKEAKTCSDLLFSKDTRLGCKKILRKSLLKDSKTFEAGWSAQRTVGDALGFFVNPADVPKLLEDGAIRIDKRIIKDPKYSLESGEWLLGIGKKKNYLIKC